MLKWPERANIAIRKLFEPLQAIDVYVEDTNDEAFYRCLLNTATNGEVTIALLFSLGGRKAVIDAAATHNQRLRRALFIIDGDLPWVKGEPAPGIIGLHCHDAYCVENLIMCEEALSVILSQEIVITKEHALAMLDYDNWVETVKSPLLELFSAFATVHDFDPTIRTVSQGVGNMCISLGTSTILDPIKVTKAKDEALKAAKKIADTNVVTERFNQLLQRLKDLPDCLRAISGKDFIIPLIDFHLRSFGCRIKRKSLRLRLASVGDVNRFKSLANALCKVAKGRF